jgi:hypothetical protein
MVTGGLDPHMSNLWKMELLILCITFYMDQLHLLFGFDIYFHLQVTAAKLNLTN